MKRKGIILAGGLGTRLYPLTNIYSKQLLPVYDKPMIYYPLSTLMLINVREILIISTPEHISSYENLFGTGKKLGMRIEYKVQPKPNGLAQSLIISENFLQGSSSVLILGDNIFHGANLKNYLLKANNSNRATIFAAQVNKPQDYGIVDFDKSLKIKSLEEKPKKPKSNYAVTGIYFYDTKASFYAKKLKPSKRGELEITDLNKIYLKKKKLNLQLLDNNILWLDSGTHDSLVNASEYFYTIEKRTGIKSACLEEIAFQNKWINKDQLKKMALKHINSPYGKYLMRVYENYNKIY